MNTELSPHNPGKGINVLCPKNHENQGVVVQVGNIRQHHRA